MNEVIVTMRDVRAAGLCSRGAKRWFDSHGLNFREFLSNGMPISQARAIGDAFSDKVVQHVEQRGGAQ